MTIFAQGELLRTMKYIQYLKGLLLIKKIPKASNCHEIIKMYAQSFHPPLLPAITARKGPYFHTRHYEANRYGQQCAAQDCLGQ